MQQVLDEKKAIRIESLEEHRGWISGFIHKSDLPDNWLKFSQVTHIFEFSFHRNAFSIVSAELIEHRSRSPSLVLGVHRSLSGALLFVLLIVRLLAAAGRAGAQVALTAAHIVGLFG